LEDIQYEENEIEVEKVEFINEQLKLLPWFSSLLFKRYIEKNYSAQTLANELLIPLSTVQYHIRKVRNTIKNNWNLKNNNGMSV
jgi:DNA-directed RNA polymerase specialized sigma24 family protein